MEVGDNILLIVGNPQGILDQELTQASPNPLIKYYYDIDLLHTFITY
jgi:hypothetical protein